MAKLTLYFVRHGKTDTNEKGLLVGQSGSPILVEEGKASAIELGRQMKRRGIVIDAVYSSPFKRTIDTAECILNGLGMTREITPIEELKDVNWGDAEGLTMQELNEKLGVSNPFSVFGDIDDASFVSPIHSESMHDFYLRFSSGVDRIIDFGLENKSVLVVAHSSMGTYFGKKFLGENGAKIDNTTITTVLYDYETKQFELIGINESLEA